MSRSKKEPYINDYSRSGTAYYKKLANKTVRRYSGIIPNGNSYRKLFCSWNIRDYSWCAPKVPKAYRK